MIFTLRSLGHPHSHGIGMFPLNNFMFKLTYPWIS